MKLIVLYLWGSLCGVAYAATTSKQGEEKYHYSIADRDIIDPDKVGDLGWTDGWYQRRK
jgi:hypothetical protein